MPKLVPELSFEDLFKLSEGRLQWLLMPVEAKTILKAILSLSPEHRELVLRKRKSREIREALNAPMIQISEAEIEEAKQVILNPVEKVPRLLLASRSVNQYS